MRRPPLFKLFNELRAIHSWTFHAYCVRQEHLHFGNWNKHHPVGRTSICHIYLLKHIINILSIISFLFFLPNDDINHWIPYDSGHQLLLRLVRLVRFDWSSRGVIKSTAWGHIQQIFRPIIALEPELGVCRVKCPLRTPGVKYWSEFGAFSPIVQSKLHTYYLLSIKIY